MSGLLCSKVKTSPHKNKWMPLLKSSECLHLRMSVASSVEWYEV